MTAVEDGVRPARLRLIAPLLVLLLTAAIYLPVLSFGFVSDDAGQIVESQPHYAWSAIPSYFSNDVWNYVSVQKTNYYRPVFLLWLLLNSKLFGLDPALWHVAAVGLHLGVTLLLYLLALRLTGRIGVAAAAALLFGVHPVHLEVAAWLSGVTESIFAILALGAILCQIQGRRIAALALFALAIFAKETAVVVPLLLASCDWLFPLKPEATRRERLRNAISTLAWCLAIGVIYLAARFHALGSLQPLAASWTARMIAATMPGTVVFYLRQLLLPIQYSMFYPVYASAQFASRQTLLAMPIVVLAAGALLWLAWRSKAFAFAALLLVLPVLPVLNFAPFSIYDFVHDRYLYLASAGLCLILAMAAARWMERWPLALRGGALGVVVAALSYVTVVFSGTWNDTLSVYAHAMQVAPDSPAAAQYLANELLTQQRFSEALPLFQTLLLMGFNNVYEPIVLCYIGMEDYDRAEAYAYREMTLDPKAHTVHIYLAEIEERLGHLAAAETQAREAIRLRPRSTPHLSGYRGELGKILELEGNAAGARAEYEAEIQEDPASTEGRERLLQMDERKARDAPAP